VPRSPVPETGQAEEKKDETKRHFKTIFAAVVAVSLMLAAVAAAQTSRVTFKGRFTLPYEVRWGKSVLTPGEYSMTISSGTSQPDFITVRGNGKTAVILVGETSSCNRCEKGELVVVQSSGRRAIRALELPGQRSLFYQAQPDRARGQLGRKNESFERIRVASGGAK
jgi:hypothetical protein